MHGISHSGRGSGFQMYVRGTVTDIIMMMYHEVHFGKCINMYVHAKFIQF